MVLCLVNVVSKKRQEKNKSKKLFCTYLKKKESAVIPYSNRDGTTQKLTHRRSVIIIHKCRGHGDESLYFLMRCETERCTHNLTVVVLTDRIHIQFNPKDIQDQQHHSGGFLKKQLFVRQLKFAVSTKHKYLR